VDGLYFGVSSERQTTENRFEDVLRVAEKDGSGRDWSRIRAALAASICEEQRPTVVPTGPSTGSNLNWRKN
jgi:hypothetical protein